MSKDGGPAFPVVVQNFGNGVFSAPTSDGMTLRDWFAGQAIPPCVDSTPRTLWAKWQALFGRNGSSYWGTSPRPDFVAKQAYAIADAILAERERTQ